MSCPLPSRIDPATTGALRLTLKTAIARGEPLVLDGGTVERAGLALLQVLLAARAAARAAGLAYRIENASRDLVDAAALAGLCAALDPA